jgi:glycosyltransferase involved in cell wall biosynthesis
MNVVFFCSEVVGYTVGMFQAILRFNSEMKIHVIHFDRNKKSMFELNSNSESLFFYRRTDFDLASMTQFLEQKEPVILYLPGWMDKDYIRAARSHKLNYPKVKIVCGIDDQWRGTLRQKIGVFYFKFFYKSVFDFMWVSGKPQYHFAQRMGYDNYHIVSDLYSANESVFNSKVGFSKRIVFLGRFVPLKGIVQLIKAYEKLSPEIKKEWPLVLIGDGEQREEIVKLKSEFIIIRPFVQPDKLMEELLIGGVACLPALFEQWSVSIHELALIGYPLLISSECGATSEFLINGYNGYSFIANKPGAIDHALKMITSLSNEDLRLFGERSRALAQRINTEYVAASFCSILFLEK